MNFRKAALWVLTLGIILRIAFAIVNLGSNDDQMSVIKVMAYENRTPETHELHQAYHPKLYHGTVAALYRLLRPQSPRVERILAQLVSVVAGILTLLLGHRFLMKEVEVSEKVRFNAFTFLALNPALIGINAQATNDSFVILFANLAFYFAWHFFQNRRGTDFCLMSGFAVLAGVTKGNGLVIFAVILAAFIIAVWSFSEGSRWRAWVGYGVGFLAIYFALVPMLGPYWKHYRLYGSPFVTNTDPRFPWVQKFEPWSVSISEGLFTFRFVDMLRNPYRVNGRGGPYPFHQNSGWSQLYGRTHFVHFDQYPPGWTQPDGTWLKTFVFNNGRLILLLALFPTVLLLTGLWTSLLSAARLLLGGRIFERPLTDWLLDLTAIGYLTFLVALFIKNREPGWFKAIYLFPGALAFLVLFARQCERFYAWCKEKKFVRFPADAILAVLLLLYVVDVTALIGKLGLSWASDYLHGTDIWNTLRVFFRSS
jgi:hypothetical protein